MGLLGTLSVYSVELLIKNAQDNHAHGVRIYEILLSEQIWWLWGDRQVIGLPAEYRNLTGKAGAMVWLMERG